jgi:hypothetical protein
LPNIGADVGDVEAARTAEIALRWFEETKQVRARRRLANWWIIVAGQYYLEPYFDPNAGPIEPVPVTDENGELEYEPVLVDGEPVPEVDPQTGQPLLDEAGQPKYKQQPKMRLAPIGDVDFVVWSPLQVEPDYRAQDWSKVRWVFVTEYASPEDVEERYPQADVGQIPKHKATQLAPWIPPLVSESGDTTGVIRPLPPLEDVITLYRYYEKPSKRYPAGRHIVYTENQILYKGDLGTPDGELPLVPVTYLDRPWQLQARDPVSPAKRVQALFNRVLSRYAEHIAKLPIGWLLVPVSSGIPKRAFTNEVGSIIRYLPGGGTPQFVFPPFAGLQWYERLLLRLENSMEERMALPPATRGQLPRGARAARTVELLQEAADAIQAPVLEGNADGWAAFYRKVLAYMDRHFTVPRFLSIVGSDRVAEVVEFKRGLLPRRWQDRLLVRVEVGESLPSTRLLRTELLLTLAGRHGLFGPPGTPDYQKKLAKALDMEDFLQADDVLDRRLAGEENLRLLKGELVQVDRLDDDAVHLEAHILLYKRLKASQKAEEAQRIIPHILAHLQQVQKKQPPPQAAPLGGPPGGPPGPPGGSPGGPTGGRSVRPPVLGEQESVRQLREGVGQPLGGEPQE